MDTGTGREAGAATGAGARERGRGVLEGAFALLDALRRGGDEAGVTELALACGVPKGSVHRLLDQLVCVGAVERAGNRYRVGPQLYRIGQAWEPHPGLRPAARLPLQRLRATTGASAVLDREDVMEGVCCAALPVRAPDGRTVAALAALVPAGRRLDALAHAVAGAGAAITRALAGGARRRPAPSAALVP